MFTNHITEKCASHKMADVIKTVTARVGADTLTITQSCVWD